MKDIKLFVACHEEDRVPKHPLLVPIQVGTALAEKRFEGFLCDDSGENISEKNRSYCELTAQYWAWKNIEAGYFGFYHYRRYLYPSKKAKGPYIIKKEPSCKTLKKLGYDNFEKLIGEYDIVVPIKENMYVSVREHYASAPYHHIKDMELAEAIVREHHPEMCEAMHKYFSGTECYFGNIYIMRRQLFHQYCNWLFPILEEFDKRADVSEYNVQEKRVDGYLAERLFGVWYTFYKDNMRTLALPRVHFERSFGCRIKKQLINIIIPPGTRRRSIVKGGGNRHE